MDRSNSLDARWARLADALAIRRDGEEAPEDLNPSPAAVLILLYAKGGEPHILLTRRTIHVAAHKGEISLPGGAFESDRDPSLQHTALREAAEEVGIDPENIAVIGRLPSVYTRSSNYLVTPFVAAAHEEPRFEPDPFEVAEVLEMPLATLRDPAIFQEEDWGENGEISIVPFYRFGEHKIWGATARILGEFLNVLEEAT